MSAQTFPPNAYPRFVTYDVRFGRGNVLPPSGYKRVAVLPPMLRMPPK